METDVTQSALFFKFWKWADAHKKHIMWGLVALVVAGFATGLVAWSKNAKERQANEALSKAAGRSPGQVALPADGLLKVSTEYAGTDAAGRAMLLAGTKLFTDGKYAEAKEQFDKYLREYRETDFTGQAQFGVASCLAAQGKTNEAVSAYKDFVDHYPNDTVAPQAKLALARLYEASGKLELARDLYADLARPELGSIGQEANMRKEELISAHPNLIPSAAPAPGTNAAPALNLKK